MAQMDKAVTQYSKLTQDDTIKAGLATSNTHDQGYCGLHNLLNNAKEPLDGLPLYTIADKSICQQNEKSSLKTVLNFTKQAQQIAQSLTPVFLSAYVDLISSNYISVSKDDDDYQKVLHKQRIVTEELKLFSRTENQIEVSITKSLAEPLGVVVVESGWGSMLPTVVLANMAPTGPAAQCGRLNIGDQIMAINGTSLVGLPLNMCQNIIKACKDRDSVRIKVVQCPPVLEVCINRPARKYQLGFSIHNGGIYSLFRGGMAERSGVRVGHHILEINSQRVAGLPHATIVSILSSAVGEIHMKTMSTPMYRILTGMDQPQYL